MEKIYLSLKTIYRMLMSNDYPVYSASVIPEKMRKGQTLLRFWQSIVSDEFRSGACGSVIWKNDGKRNRYLSGLCNRSGEYRIHREYTGELMESCNEEALLKQISRFSEFLACREFRYDILIRRVKELMRILKEEDPMIGSALPELIQNTAEAIAEFDGDKQGKLFQSGYLLTVMMLYAASGKAMDDPALNVLLEERFSMSVLWQNRRRPDRELTQTMYLTSHSCILQSPPLPMNRFFGREEALFDIREMILSQKKCLISGIGGIGKTELLRQLLRLCEQEQLTDKLAVISYNGGLAESIVHAFGNHSPLQIENAYRGILSQIRKESENGTRILLMIDDIYRSEEEDPDLNGMAQLPCAVVVTSRRSVLPGFETYRLGALSITTGTLIFRDNYCHPLSPEDKRALPQLLESQEMCHPLTLSLMAKAAACKGWSVSQLMEFLLSNGTDLTWVEQDRVQRASKIFNRLYSILDVPESCRQIADLFTLLPSGSYSPEFLAWIFPECSGEDNAFKLKLLVRGGWLDALEDGFSMHPMISECLRRRILTEEKQGQRLEALCACLPQIQLYRLEKVPEETQRIARILLHMTGLITGKISANLMISLLNAVSLCSMTRTGQEHMSGKLAQWKKQCLEWDPMPDLLYNAVLACWNMPDPVRCKEIYRDQKTCLTVPQSLFHDFCLAAGQSMTYLGDGACAEALLKELLQENVHPMHHAMALWHLSGYSHIHGSSEKALDWAEQGVAYVRSHPECGKKARFHNLHMLNNMCVKYRREDQALELIREMEKLADETDRVEWSQYLSALGLYEMTFGDPEKALVYIQEHLEIYGTYFGKERDYYISVSMLGNICIRLNRLDQAVAYYSEAISFAQGSGDQNLLQSASNNISVAYLKSHMPLEALHHLKTAVEEGSRVGGLMYGESLRNTAMAHDQLGDREQAWAFYQKAWPILLDAYGPEHPRVLETKEQMNRLQNAPV